MDSFEELLRQAEIAHGHLCAGQILGVRMALLACRRLEVTEPRGADRKKLVSFDDALTALTKVEGASDGRLAANS